MVHGLARARYVDARASPRWGQDVDHITLAGTALYELDLDTPDLWAELRNEAELLEANPVPGASNAPFTEVEQAQIANRLRELAEDARHANSLL
jgi:hypothetical protein